MIRVDPADAVRRDIVDRTDLEDRTVPVRFADSVPRDPAAISDVGLHRCLLRAVVAVIVEQDSGSSTGHKVPVGERGACALWPQEGLPFPALFLDTLAAQDGAGVRVLDYVDDTDGPRQAING